MGSRQCCPSRFLTSRNTVLTDTSVLAGRRILVVEDEVLVSMLVEDILLDFGCVIVGPAAKLEDAVALAQSETIDIGLLDVNLGRTLVFPVADVLSQRGIPFVFVSGYGESALQPPHQDRPVLEKPFSPETIGDVLAGLLKG